MDRNHDRQPPTGEPRVEHPRPEHITRRRFFDLMARVAAALVGASVFSAEPALHPHPQSPAETSVDLLSHEEAQALFADYLKKLTFVDYFTGTISDQLVEQLLNTLDDASQTVQQLRERYSIELRAAATSFPDDLIYTSLNQVLPNGLDLGAIFNQAQYFRGLLRPIVRVMANKVIEIAGQHGRLVEGAALQRLAKLLEQSGVPVDPYSQNDLGKVFQNNEKMLADTFGELSVKIVDDSATVTLVAGFTIDPEKMATLLSAGEVGPVLCLASQFGNVEVRSRILERQLPLCHWINVDSTGQTKLAFFVPKNSADLDQEEGYSLSGQFTTQLQSDGDINLSPSNNIDVLGEVTIATPPSGTIEKMDMLAAAQQLAQQNPTFKQYLEQQLWQPTWPQDPAHQQFIEPYSPHNTLQSENWQKLTEFASEMQKTHPQLLIIQAAGNNSDLRGLQVPENVLTVCSLGGSKRFRSENFGTDPNWTMGAPGAELYVDAKDFSPDGTTSLPFSTSEATGIISGYCSILTALDSSLHTSAALKARLLQFTRNGKITLSDTEKPDVKVLDRAALDQHILQLMKLRFRQPVS